MADPVDYYSIGDDADVMPYGTYWRGQTFTASKNYTIASLRIMVIGRGTYSDKTCVFEIQNTDIDNDPDGTTLAQGTMYGSDLIGGSEWTEVILDSTVDLTNATVYAIVAHSSDADASNGIEWRYDSDGSGGGYAGGSWTSSTDSGTTWGPYEPYDMVFETYEISVGGGHAIAMGAEF